LTTLAALTEIFFPPTCVACARVLPADAFFCERCDGEVDRIPEPHCSLCAEPGEFALGQCERCQRQQPAFDRAFAPFVHEGAIARAIHQLKYEDHPELARPLAALLRAEASRFLAAAPAVVCAIPLHTSRLHERRFDQAALLARELASTSGRSFRADLLARTRKTERQVGLAEDARRLNLAGAFVAQGPTPKQVLLVDDVLTTGATARAAAQVLKAAGAERVQVLTLARAYSA
jgi:ComF family protein